MVILILICCLPLIGQTFEFKDGLKEWTANGSAFDGQPVAASRILSDRIAPVTIGGDYWRGLSYPLGQSGEFLIATAALHGDGAVGTLTSRPFELDRNDPYLSVLISGTRDLEGERFELQVFARTDEAALLERQLAASGLRKPASTRDGDYLTVITATGGGYEALRQEIFGIPEFLLGRRARIKLVDSSATGHINVDAIRMTHSAPEPRPPSVWGYADYHTHPMNYLAFGGLKGLRVVWGNPGGNYDYYKRDPALIDEDMARCIRGHGGGPYANPFLNGVQLLQYVPTANLLLFAHGKHGAPDYRDFPSFKAGAHEQMHITQIRRNYEGGLRLMAGIATDNTGAEYLGSSVENGDHVVVIDERRSIEAQVAGMVEQARLNSSWMQIAYSPEDAREIILHNKLAVVLGVEVDQLGTYHLAPEPDREAEYEVEYLWNLGIRAVLPIHAANNRLGGAATFTPPYNWLNDLLHRDKFDMTKDELNVYAPKYFDVDTQTCSAPVGECVQYHFEPTQDRLFIGVCLESFFRRSPCLKHNVPVDQYRLLGGHRNRQEFTRFGRQFLEALMNRGMILDTAHMSDKSVDAVYSFIGERLLHDHPECGGDLKSNAQGCDRFAYPAIISHAHFRAQALYDGDNFVPSEYDISNHNLELVRRVGGVVGPFTSEDRIASSDQLAFHNDCAQSSKSFGYSFDFAHRTLGTNGVGMATDFTFIPGTAPRFGPDACWAYRMAKDPGKEKKDHPDRYAFGLQDKGALYQGISVKRGVRVAPNAPLTYYQMGKRKFDFNVDGMAHFGMVPDMLQDLKNLGTNLAPLFSSAEGYIRMWEKAERVSHARPSTSR